MARPTSPHLTEMETEACWTKDTLPSPSKEEAGGPGDIAPQVNTLLPPRREHWRPRVPLSSAKSPTHSLDAGPSGWVLLVRAEQTSAEFGVRAGTELANTPP